MSFTELLGVVFVVLSMGSVTALFMWARVEWHASILVGLISPLVYMVLAPLLAGLVPDLRVVLPALLWLLEELGMSEELASQILMWTCSYGVFMGGTFWVTRNIRKTYRVPTAAPKTSAKGG